MRNRAIALIACTAIVGCGGSVGQSRANPSQSAAAPSPSPSPVPSPSGPDWPEYHHDAGRTGAGPTSPPFGNPRVAWAATLDGAVYASPLIVAGKVIVATENNTVYRIDLVTGAVDWKQHLGDPVASGSLPCGDIGPVTGITGTPAATADGLYVVAYLKGFHHSLFNLAMADGSVRSSQVIDPAGSNPDVQQQRGALAIGADYVYVALGGLYGDCGNYRGYVVGVPLHGGSTNVYTTPGRESGIWAASGPTVAADGSIYVVTGNGGASSFDYSDSVLQLSPTLGLVSYFAPSNWAQLSRNDTDLGSAGVAVLSSGYAFVVGKEGVGDLLRAGALGGIGGQVASGPVCSAAFGGSAWSDDTIYEPCTNGLTAVRISGQSFSVAWRASGISTASPILSAGVIWAIDPGNSVLYAIDPASGAALYSHRLGSAEHFSTPAATSGYVIAPAGTSVVALATD